MSLLPALPVGSFVVGRFRPTDTDKAENLELPGAGVYEADFKVPGWLVPDFTSDNEFTKEIDGREYTHLASASKGDLFSIRFRVGQQKPLPPEIKMAGVPTPGLALRALGVLGVSGFVVGMIVKTLTEVRKIVSVPGGPVLVVGAGVLALGFGVKALTGR